MNPPILPIEHHHVPQTPKTQCAPTEPTAFLPTLCDQTSPIAPPRPSSPTVAAHTTAILPPFCLLLTPVLSPLNSLYLHGTFPNGPPPPPSWIAIILLPARGLSGLLSTCFLECKSVGVISQTLAFLKSSWAERWLGWGKVHVFPNPTIIFAYIFEYLFLF